MSVSHAVLLFDAKVPEWPTLASLADQRGYNISFIQMPDLRSAEGTIVALIDGKKTALCFDYTGLSEFDWLPDELSEFGDRLWHLPAVRGDRQDIHFAIRMEQLMCEAGHGAWWALDFDDQFAIPADAVARLEEELC